MLVAACGLGFTGSAGTANAQELAGLPGLILPESNSENGRALFVSKACVVCHSINEVGGENAAPLDAASMDETGNPFEFFARMWLGMKPMIEMQEELMGEQVELTAQELGDIVAFIHDAEQQATFSAAEIPDKIEDLMQSD